MNITKMDQNGLITYFREFSSIESPSSKHIKQLEKYGYLNSSIEWIALEKIHGANFSFITDGIEIITAKRSGIISEKEKFFNSTAISKKYLDDILTLYHVIKKTNPETTTVQVFGEIFGGYYPGFTNNMKPVQKGVYYRPEIDFLVFDIKMNTNISAPKIATQIHNNINDGKMIDEKMVDEKMIDEKFYSWFLSQDEIDKYLKNLPLLRGIPVTARGKFDDIINMSPIFITKIPELYGLPLINNNMAEGYVFKTNNRHPCHRSRPIIKIKNNNVFGEVVHMPKVNIGSGVTNQYVENAISYCTKNRFNNTISKIGLENRIEKINGIYVADVVKDFEKDLPDEELEEFKKSIKKVKEGINSYLLRHGHIESWLKEFHF
jgi:uncharacterized protein YlbG (UPF0298 family)